MHKLKKTITLESVSTSDSKFWLLKGFEIIIEDIVNQEIELSSNKKKAISAIKLMGGN